MEMTKPKNSFAVICHGDLWLSNILFKYNAISGTNGGSDDDQIEIRPIEVKFIDFQSARFASLATDLVLFLFTSVSRKNPNVSKMDSLPIMVRACYKCSKIS